jgi:TolB-like protein
LLIGLVGCATVHNENIIEATDFTSDHVKLAVRQQYRSVAVLPFENATQYTTADQHARRAFFGAMAAYKNYDLQPMEVTDRAIRKLARSTIDPAHYATLRAALGTDLLVFGTVLAQDHSYGVVYGRNAVRVKILFVDAATGDIVWQSEESRARTLVGVSFISLFNNEYMWAREVVNRYNELFRDMITTLPDCSAPTPHNKE